jgi:hypothetical protein
MYTAFDFIEEAVVAIFFTIQVDGDSFLHTTLQIVEESRLKLMKCVNYR